MISHESKMHNLLHVHCYKHQVKDILLGKPSKKINSGYNEFGTISLNTLPPLINSEKSNSENWSQSGYPPSLRK